VTTRVVATSGGTGSWAAGMLVARAMEPGDRLVQLFSDTRTEDPDLYRDDIGGCGCATGDLEEDRRIVAELG
jgi:hypothetical protein